MDNPYGMEFEEVVLPSSRRSVANEANITNLQQLFKKKPQSSRSIISAASPVSSSAQSLQPDNRKLREQSESEELHLKTIKNFENNIIASLNQIDGHLKTILDRNEKYSQRLKKLATQTRNLWIRSGKLQLTQGQKFRLKPELQLHLKDHVNYLFQTIASLENQIKIELASLLKKKHFIRFTFFDDTQKQQQIKYKIKKLERLLQNIEVLNLKLQILNK